jgi:hypothetical protein
VASTGRTGDIIWLGNRLENWRTCSITDNSLSLRSVEEQWQDELRI